MSTNIGSVPHIGSVPNIGSVSVSPRCPWAMVTVISATLMVAFFVADHQFNFSTMDILSLEEDLSPSPLRKAYYLLLAGMGCLLLLLPARTVIRLNSSLVVAAMLYAAWAAGSVLWSANPLGTMKALLTVAIVAFCGLGVARQLSLRDIVVVAFLASTAFVLVGIAAEITYGTWSPGRGSYRFTGTIHPNEQAGVCAIMCWSAWFCGRRFSRGKWLLWAFSLLAFGLLVLTKSRTCLVAFLLSSCGLWAARSRWQGRAAVALGVCIVTAGAAMFVLVLDMDAANGLGSAAMLGRQNEGEESDLGSLNGRWPLWATTLTLAREHLFVGHGYGAFWTSQRVQSVAAVVGWSAPNAHSFWIDTILDLGAIGLFFVLLMVVAYGHFLFKCVQQSADPTTGFAFMVFVLVMITACAESDLHHPTSFVPFVLGISVARLAFCQVKMMRRSRPPFSMLRHSEQIPEF